MENLCLHNIIIHCKFYQNQSINECARMHLHNVSIHRYIFIKIGYQTNMLE